MNLTSNPTNIKPKTINAIYLENKGIASKSFFNPSKNVSPKASLQEIADNTFIKPNTTNIVTSGHTRAFLSPFSSAYKKNTSSTSSFFLFF